MDFVSYIIYFIITIAILVFVHEFGHFAAAKLSGMRADIFAIGFGKRLFGYNKLTGFTFGDLPKDFDGQGNTDYRVCLLPLGGYVKIAGMVDETTKDEALFAKEPEEYEFRAKSTPKKMFVITAGVLMNLLLALLIFWGVNYYKGKQVTKTTTIGYVDPGSKVDSLGFKHGDRIISVNGKQMQNWEEVLASIYIHTLGDDLNVRIDRGGNEEVITVPRRAVPEETREAFIIPDNTKPAIGEVVPGSPAEKAGIKSGDIFLALNKEEVFSPAQTTRIISTNEGNQLPLTVLRQQDTLNLAVTPDSEGKIGVRIGYVYRGEIEHQEFGIFESFLYGWGEIERMTNLTFSMLGKVFTGKVEFKKAFGGPIKIAQVATTSAEAGFVSFLYFLALLSLSLAIINIMPFPVLDGGHLIMIAVEGIMKREIPLKVKIAIQNVGVVLLLLLMAFIIYNDILSL
jgi:regulator of sigma E protease